MTREDCSMRHSAHGSKHEHEHERGKVGYSDKNRDQPRELASNPKVWNEWVKCEPVIARAHGEVSFWFLAKS